jgi:transposase, IS5 family
MSGDGDAHPSDAHSLLRAIQTLARMAKVIKLRRSFLFVAKAARVDVTRLLHQVAKKPAMRNVRKLRTFAGRLVPATLAGKPRAMSA